MAKHFLTLKASMLKKLQASNTFVEKAMATTPVLLPGKSHGWRSLVGCSPWGRWESDTTERLHFDFSLLCIGEGNGNSLQCSCLENHRDGRAWWAAVYVVTQSRTRLKQLSIRCLSRLGHLEDSALNFAVWVIEGACKEMKNCSC